MHAHESVQAKVMAIVREWVPDRVNAIDSRQLNVNAMTTLETALARDYPATIARDIAFHLTDWNWEAAFLVAMHLYPERFTLEELDAGIRLLLIHAPNHLAAAAKLAGHPVEDIFRD